ncbi:peptide chain release factor N(5)-glutamine methyltransferase [Paraglaciecola aestuariivivens]
MSIQQALEWAKLALAQAQVSDDGESDSSGIDSKILLAAILQKDQVFLHTWPEQLLEEKQWQHFSQAVQQRIDGHPVAHIIGYRDFWSLRLEVNPSTLIPRPETELLVELALDLNLADQSSVLDLGTGTGAIALALASEQASWKITAIDKSDEAVVLAKRNAKRLKLDQVEIKQSNWFENLVNQKFDLILSNPPYIEDKNIFLQKGDVRFEPASALTSGIDGLDDIRLIVSHSKAFLAPSGILAIEHGYQQSEAVQAIFKQNGFANIRTQNDLNHLPRVTMGNV